MAFQDDAGEKTQIKGEKSQSHLESIQFVGREKKHMPQYSNYRYFENSTESMRIVEAIEIHPS